MWIFNLALVIAQIRGQFPVVNDCKKAHDTALEKQQFVGSPAFPRRSMATSNCKFTVSVNYGVYIKLTADILEIPCVGNNGVYIEEKGGRAGPFCAKKKMPAFVSRDVFMDIHIIVDTPLEPGWRVKIGYKAVKGKSGPKLPPAGRGNPPPPIMASMEQIGRMPDQGQSLLQQTNRQNAELNAGLPQEAFPQSFDQKQPQNENSLGFGPSGGGGFGISLKSALKPKKKTWESKTWNGDRNQGEAPVFTSLGKPKLGLQEPKSSSGGGVIMAVVLLIIMICVAIFLVHKRQEMIKEEMKKQDAEAMKEDEANKKSTFMPIQTATMEKKEPTVDEINTCIEKNQTKGMTISRDSGCAILSSSDQSEAFPKAPQRTNGCPNDLPEAAAPKRTCSEDSNDSSKSKESQATTAPSISEYPKPPERKKRTGIRGPN